MKHWSCDVCGERRLVPSEVTTLTLRGPARSAFLRGELHACKPCLHRLAPLFNIPLAPPPAHLAEDMADRRKAEVADLGPFAVNVGSPVAETTTPAALVVKQGPKAAKGRQGRAG